MQHAVLAAEDRDFYRPRRLLQRHRPGRWNNLTGGPTQGGSTITQQYVKNDFLTQERTVTPQDQGAPHLGQARPQKSKDQILEDYLNTIYFGRGAYGIQAAAQAYFGENVSQLTAGPGRAARRSIIRAPASTTPSATQQKQNAQARWNYVLDGMVRRGLAHPGRARQGDVPEDLPAGQQTNRAEPPATSPGRAGRSCAARRLTDDEIDRGGLRIITTFNQEAQDASVKAVQDNMPTGPAPTLHVGPVAIDPGNGDVVAMYGGKDYTSNQVNTATAATSRPGRRSSRSG